jgi:hypothetical protein
MSKTFIKISNEQIYKEIQIHNEKIDGYLKTLSERIKVNEDN